jgi:hypothetical protein
MAVNTGIAVAIEIIANGPLLGYFQVVRHDIGLFYRRGTSFVCGHVYVFAKAGDGGVALSLGQLSENFIVGSVFFGHVYDVFDRALPHARQHGHGVFAVVCNRYFLECIA